MYKHKSVHVDTGRPLNSPSSFSSSATETQGCQIRLLLLNTLIHKLPANISGSIHVQVKTNLPVPLNAPPHLAAFESYSSQCICKDHMLVRPDIIQLRHLQHNSHSSLTDINELAILSRNFFVNCAGSSPQALLTVCSEHPTYVLNAQHTTLIRWPWNASYCVAL